MGDSINKLDLVHLFGDFMVSPIATVYVKQLLSILENILPLKISMTNETMRIICTPMCISILLHT